jgi:hypothetical protein
VQLSAELSTAPLCAHVNLGFFMAYPARLLQGIGKFMRYVKLKPGTASKND